MKRILITGEHGYIGTSLKKWLEQWPEQYTVELLSVRSEDWRVREFSRYDTVIHAAAIVHKKEKNRHLYETVNCKMPVELYKKCQEEGVPQFIFISSAAVFAGRDRLGQELVLRPDSPAGPYTEYGKSKWKAECHLRRCRDTGGVTKLAIVRPPLVYGPGCPGNYGILSRLACIVPVIPEIENRRSMIFIDNLSSFFQKTIDLQREGLFLPQNQEYVSVTKMTEMIAALHGKKIYKIRWLNPAIRFLSRWIDKLNIIYGSNIYEHNVSKPEEYCVTGFAESLRKTELKQEKQRDG